MRNRLADLGVGIIACSLMISMVGANSASADTIAILARRVITVSGPEIRNGIVLVRSGKIVYVGRGASVPSGAKVIRAAVVMPGLVDAHSYLGCGNETEEPVDAVVPDVRASDAFDSNSPMVQRAVESGITLVGLASGNGNVMAGQMSTVRLGRHSKVLDRYAAQKISISQDAANGLRNPTSRAGVAAIARAALLEAREGRSVSSTRQTGLLVGEFSTGLSERADAIKRVLGGKKPVFLHAPDTSDVQAALRFAEEYRLRPVLLHALGASRLAEIVQRSRASVVLGPLTLETDTREMAAAGKLARAGVTVAFCTDAPRSDPGSLRMSARLAVSAGMSTHSAIRSITLSGAEALGLADRTGSLAVGKDADLLVLSGDPLDLTSRIEAVISGGKVEYKAVSR